MKNKIFLLFLFITIFIQTLFSQINLFNFFKPYQSTVSCPVSTYGLELQMNYSIIDINTAELQIPISLYWGIYDNLEIGMAVGGISRSYKETVEKGVSDILFGSKYTFVKEEKSLNKPWPTVSAEFALGLPTGDYRKGFGTGGVGLIVLWLLEKEIVLKTQHYFNLLVNLGYRYNTVNPDGFRYGESLLYSFSSWFNLTESFRLYFGVKGENKKKNEQDGIVINGSEKFESYLYCGINYDLDEYRKFFSAIFLGITEDAKDLVFNIGMMY